MVPSIFNRFLSSAERWLPQLLNLGIRLLIQLANGLIRSLPTLISYVGQIGGRILSSFGSIDLWSIGSNLLRGLWNGISSKTSWILSKVRGVASSILSKVRSVFGVHSPSTEFAWVGEMNMEGLYQGMDESQGKVQGLIDSMFNLQPNVSPMMTIQRESEDYSSAFTNAINNMQERPVVIDVRADEGIIVQKATQGFREFQRANGRLPF